MNISFSNNNKSSCSNNKIGRRELAQSNTYLRLTQDRHMQSTMKNLTFVARHVRCTIKKEACVSGVRKFGFGVHTSHLPMNCRVLGVEADLEGL